MSTDEFIPLSILALDLPTLDRRSLSTVTVTDDVGRECVARSTARLLIEEHREEQARRVQHAKDLEQQAIAADQRFRAQLPRGIPVDAVPEGLTAGMLMMLADPMDDRPRRETLVEHSLRHSGGGVVFHSVEGASDYRPGGG